MNACMTHKQHPLETGFTAASTADEVLGGVDVTFRMIAGGYRRLAFFRSDKRLGLCGDNSVPCPFCRLTGHDMGSRSAAA